MQINVFVYANMYACLCLSVCVCVREREREEKVVANYNIYK